jgi:hypothetical protein
MNGTGIQALLPQPVAQPLLLERRNPASPNLPTHQSANVPILPTLFLRKKQVIGVLASGSSIAHEHAAAGARLAIDETPGEKAGGRPPVAQQVDVAARALGVDDRVGNLVSDHLIVFACQLAQGLSLASVIALVPE